MVAPEAPEASTMTVSEVDSLPSTVIRVNDRAAAAPRRGCGWCASLRGGATTGGRWRHPAPVWEGWALPRETATAGAGAGWAWRSRHNRGGGRAAGWRGSTRAGGGGGSATTGATSGRPDALTPPV